jgi:uncharacterized protein involved in type VI secretion and phage assembly
MVSGLVDTAAQAEAAEERRLYGVTVARVVNNIDRTGNGRVQIHLPWLPEVEPWARVAVLMAGANRGTFFVPQEEDEVLVAFNQGDIRDPYVIGSLWNGQDPPPTTEPEDAIHKRIVRTPVGHEIAFDDSAAAVHITSCGGHKIHIDREEILIETSGAEGRIRLNNEGELSIEATQSLSLSAPEISLEAERTIDIQADTRVSVDGGQACELQATMIQLNC